MLSFIKQVQNRALPDYLQGLQIPNSPLMLFQNLGFGIVVRTFFGRKRKDSAPTTTSKPDSGSTPCTCDLGICKCCTGYIMDLLNQKACMRVTYHPGDFAFDVAMSLNDRILYENSMSGLYSTKSLSLRFITLLVYITSFSTFVIYVFV